MSGNIFIDEHLQNKNDISVILFVFHLDILGISFKEVHSKNNFDILLTLFIFHFEILINSVEYRI